jgi:CRISPR-associated endonuclease/helicase Cas3
LEQLAAPMRSILRLHEGDVLAPDALKKYFSDVYYTKGAELDKHQILKSIKETEECDFSFQTIASQFRMIDSHMLPIIVPFDDVANENLELLRKLPEHMSVGKIAQKLQRYVVQVPEKAFIQLLKVGAVAVVAPEKFGNQFYELVGQSLYSRIAGLNFSDPVAMNAEASVF